MIYQDPNLLKSSENMYFLRAQWFRVDKLRARPEPQNDPGYRVQGVLLRGRCASSQSGPYPSLNLGVATVSIKTRSYLFMGCGQGSADGARRTSDILRLAIVSVGQTSPTPIRHRLRQSVQRLGAVIERAAIATIRS